jgi:hypothetical protein
MKHLGLIFILVFLSIKSLSQNCDLGLLFESKEKIEIISKLFNFGKSTDHQIKKIDDIVFSGTSYEIIFDGCRFYLPVVESFNDSKFTVGQEFIFTIAYVYVGRNKKYYYINEVRFIE